MQPSGTRFESMFFAAMDIDQSIISHRYTFQRLQCSSNSCAKTWTATPVRYHQFTAPATPGQAISGGSVALPHASHLQSGPWTTVGFAMFHRI